MNEHVVRYAHYFDTLELSTVGRIRELVVPEFHFRDPFNDIYGVEQVVGVFEELFHDTIDPKFQVTHITHSGEMAFLRWRFTFRPRTKLISAREPWEIVGMSELRCNADGKIVEHIDHWDAGRYFYERLPLLGALVRLVRRRISRAGEGRRISKAVG